MNRNEYLKQIDDCLDQKARDGIQADMISTVYQLWQQVDESYDDEDFIQVIIDTLFVALYYSFPTQKKFVMDVFKHIVIEQENLRDQYDRYVQKLADLNA